MNSQEWSVVVGAVGAIVVGALSSNLMAQTPTFQFTLAATEVHAGTMTPVASSNGLLEPGEGILFRLESVLFSPPVGTIVSTPLGPGPVAGLASLTARLESLGGGAGVWSNIYVDPAWRGFGSNPVPERGGAALAPIEFLHFPPPLGTINPTNPIENAMHAVWTPLSYEPRTVEWSLIPNFAPWGSLYVHYGNDPTTGQPLYTTIQINTGPIGARQFIQIIPGPAGGALLAISSLWLCRRCRAGSRRRVGPHPGRFRDSPVERIPAWGGRVSSMSTGCI